MCSLPFGPISLCSFMGVHVLFSEMAVGYQGYACEWMVLSQCYAVGSSVLLATKYTDYHYFVKASISVQ